jgi:exodeoxyribonuclease VII large subunit
MASSAAGKREPEEDDLFSRVEAEEARVLSVSELTARIRGSLEGLGRIRVEGEISGLRPAASGHVYFTLKDIDAVIACAIWKSRAKTAAAFRIEEGQSVIAHGRLDVYGPRGSYTLIVERLEEKGLGARLAELERLKAELRAKGWFDRHRPLPKMPRVIGVVTSRDGAAFQDFLRTRSLRWPLYPVRLAHTPVQGPSAAREIAAAIARLDASGVDVIVLCRGGGSLEDLWSFNELVVAQAIWAASVPVVSGVGHETDVTLADLVADHRAHTPTDAAQTVLPDRAQLASDLERAANHLMQAIDGVFTDREERLVRVARAPVLRDAKWMLERRGEVLELRARALQMSLARRFEESRARIEREARRLERHRPEVAIERASSRVAALAPRLSSAVIDALRARRQKVELAAATLEATSPFRVLARGYSITRRVGAKEPLTNSAPLAAGDRVETLLATGSFVSAVESKGRDPGSSRP